MEPFDLTARVDVFAKPADFADWDGLLALLRDAFATMDGRIEPPSSLHRFDAAALAAAIRLAASWSHPARSPPPRQ